MPRPLDNAPLVAFREVTKVYHRHVSLFSKRGSEVTALDRISFEIYPGEIFSLVGESGSGKTTCGRLLLRLEDATSGQVFFDGQQFSKPRRKEMRTFRNRVQMIFQDPYQSLNPQLTVFQTVAEPLVVQRYGNHRQREEKVQAVLEEVGLKPAEDFLFRYPHQLSGGQRQRVAVARAMVLDPEFVVADEPVSMLDASVQAQLLNILLDLKERRSLTLLFITHDLATARYLSDRITVMYRGRIMEHGPAEEVIQAPLHPYTRTLLEAVPTIRRPGEDLAAPTCPVDQFVAPPRKGCPFSTRCPNCSAQCLQEEAALQEVERKHYAACFLHYG
jgi:oligopeptide/dipeptide ABC transporter ATP-binding protein